MCVYVRVYACVYEYLHLLHQDARVTLGKLAAREKVLLLEACSRHERVAPHLVVCVCAVACARVCICVCACARACECACGCVYACV